MVARGLVDSGTHLFNSQIGPPLQLSVRLDKHWAARFHSMFTGKEIEYEDREHSLMTSLPPRSEFSRAVTCVSRFLCLKLTIPLPACAFKVINSVS